MCDDYKPPVWTVSLSDLAARLGWPEREVAKTLNAHAGLNLAENLVNHQAMITRQNVVDVVYARRADQVGARWAWHVMNYYDAEYYDAERRAKHERHL